MPESVKFYLFLKNYRKEAGFSQKELAQDICHVDTLRQFERGTKLPSRYVFDKIMCRLGINPKYLPYDFITVHDVFLAEKKERLQVLLRIRTPEAIAEAEQTLDALYHFINQDTLLHEGLKHSTRLAIEQFISRIWSSIHSYHKSYKQSFDAALESICLTVPHFDPDTFTADTLLNYEELASANLIGCYYYNLKDYAKGAEFFQKLHEIIEYGYSYGEDQGRLHIVILFNLTNCLDFLEEYEQSVAFCDLALGLCRRYQHSFHYPLLLFNKSYCLFYLGQIDEAIALCKKSSAILWGYGRTAELAFQLEWAKTHLNVTFDF